jgi:transposase
VARDAQRLRQAQGVQPRARRPGQTLPRVVAGQPQPLTPCQATRVVLKRPEPRTHVDRQLLAPLESQPGDLAGAIGLAQDCGALVRQPQADRVDAWLARAVARSVAPLQRVAMGFRADDEAVKAGLRRPWSNGPVAGHINRLTMLTRQRFGRATLDRLSRRFPRAA